MYFKIGIKIVNKDHFSNLYIFYGEMTWMIQESPK